MYKSYMSQVAPGPLKRLRQETLTEKSLCPDEAKQNWSNEGIQFSVKEDMWLQREDLNLNSGELMGNRWEQSIVGLIISVSGKHTMAGSESVWNETGSSVKSQTGSAWRD